MKLMMQWSIEIPLDPPLQKGEDFVPHLFKGKRLRSPLLKRGVRGDFPELNKI